MSKRFLKALALALTIALLSFPGMPAGNAYAADQYQAVREGTQDSLSQGGTYYGVITFAGTGLYGYCLDLSANFVSETILQSERGIFVPADKLATT